MNIYTLKYHCGMTERSTKRRIIFCLIILAINLAI